MEKIRAQDRIASVLARDERMLDVLVASAPAFKKLRNPLLRRTMAALVTVEQAAQIAGLEAGALVARLNETLADGAAVPSTPLAQRAPIARAPVPPHLAAIPSSQLVDLDVREELRAGREPFARIMGAVRQLAPGQVLRLRAIFEPAPLYGVLAKKGLGHFTEQLHAEDWRVWFFPDESAAVSAQPVEASAPEEDVVILDVRGLEPPEPMVRTFEALERLPRGRTLLQINVRVPQFLLPKLAERGFVYEIREQSPDLVRVFIRHQSI